MKVFVENDNLIIQPEGWERFWSLSGEISVPTRDITAAKWIKHANISYNDIGLRVGTAMPWVLVAGRFFSRKGRSYLYLKRSKFHWSNLEVNDQLYIELINHLYRYIRITAHG